MHPSVWIAIASGIALAAACGLRAFLPLWVLGLTGRAGWIELAPSVSWLTSDLALVALGVATLVELTADKIPLLDHALDALGLVVRPMAAWLAAYALMVDWPAPWGQAVAFLLALMALGIQSAKAKLRVGSSALTMGAGNPLLSFLEDAVTLVTSVAAIVLPGFVLLFLAFGAWWLRGRTARLRVVREPAS